MCDVPQPQRDEKLVSSLLTLWAHQNGILWGRLQNVGVIQVAVIAGWYTLHHSHRYRDAAFVALLGSALAGAVYLAVHCDLKWRLDIKTRLERIDDRIFPQNVGGVSGWKIITGIGVGFLRSEEHTSELQSP